MPNGKPTMRDMVVRIDERTLNFEKAMDTHLKNHKWFIGVVIVIPTAVLAIMLIVR